MKPKICQKCSKIICFKSLGARMLMPVFLNRKINKQKIHPKSLLGKIFFINGYCEKYL